jgi:hypothetical protein
MANYRYQLQKYLNPASRERCPRCDKPREVTRYVDTETGEVLPAEYGSCNRKDKCGYHESPYQKDSNGDSYSKSVWLSERDSTPLHIPKLAPKPREAREVVKLYLSAELCEKTLKTSYFAQNNFARFVLRLCKDEAEMSRAISVLNSYKVGTCSAGTVFWFVDIESQVHAGQVKQFSLDTGKTEATTWIHSVLQKAGNKEAWLKAYYEQDQKVGCLFGEHLLALPENEGKTVCVVESPKNAILASIFLPNDFIYVATYSLSAFTAERCKAIAGRDVLLLPDLGKATEVWKETAPNFLDNYAFLTFLEVGATDAEKERGEDVADLIVRQRTAGKVSYKELADLPVSQFLDECEFHAPNTDPFDFFTELIPKDFEFIAKY